MDRKWFQFQTGSIKSILQEEYAMVLNEFQFQTGSIRRLSKNYINIILYPYSSCQVNFSFASNQRQFAVDL